VDIHLLEEKFGRTLNKTHFRNLRICNMLLKLGAEADLTPKQIGEIMSRENLKVTELNIIENNSSAFCMESN
jgi:hypothetical protein